MIVSTQQINSTSVLWNDDYYGRIVVNITASLGWTLVFDKPYNYAVNTEDLRDLVLKCSTKVMVAARQVNESTLIAAASGPSAVLQ